MKNPWAIITLFCFFSLDAFSQKQLERKVSFDYREVSLGYALDDLGTRYDIPFSYSRDFIPLSEQVNARVDKESLANGLDMLLSNTKVVYTSIGNYVVLRSDPNKEINKKPEKDLIGEYNEKPQPIVRPLVETETYTSSIDPGLFERTKSKPRSFSPAGEIETRQLERINHTFSSEEFLREIDDIKIIEKEFPGKSGVGFSAQVSLISKLGTNLGKSDTMTNNVSINVISGKNGGVEGLEIGTLYNGIEKDMKGAQISGLINNVKGDVKGITAKDDPTSFKPGLQIAGLANVSTNVEGLQVAGLANVTRGDLEGGQIASISNKVKGNAKGFQIAGISNKSLGNADIQISGLGNKAEDVKTIQMSALLNRAKTVKGFQVGLINVSDTIAGAAIGLLNFTKRGYNRVEFSTGELIDLNFNIKFGGHHFYNILQFGKISQRKDRPTGWALGYGVGSSWRSGKKGRSNIEIIGSHVNEGRFWTNNLNLLGQLKMTRSWVLGRKFEIFAGPSFNILFSDIIQSEEQEIGSGIVPYTIIDRDVERNIVVIDNTPEKIKLLNYKFWVGFTTGIRF